MRRIALVLAVLLATTGLVFAAGGRETARDGYMVGYVCNNFNDTFQTYVMDAARDYFVEVDDVSITFQDAQEDVIRQQDLVNTFITQGVDALIVVPVDTSAMSPIIRAASEANVPLIFVNRNPFGETTPPENVYYVGSQEIVAGRMQMEEMGKLLGGEGGVAILMGRLDNEGAILRTEGNEEVIAEEFPNIRVLAKETGLWQRDQGMSLTENWITAYGNRLNGILANNDEMALGAAEALRSAGRTDVPVMGVDAIPDALEAVRQGILAATVLQDSVGQGGGSARLAHQILKGESVEQVTWVPFVLINQDNLDQFID
ncbi:monosaccharide ABC transporter substrate-binding protein, CUT2 family [Alkalispirochaeta americana]|uniref:Monosaccharide ABC transporter substrate-binding protein, CUT2 family n=1 Tax=Alkalispirochaeta americana TaxID=159291 RepID=A0A1N6XP10_9SPIO|nr:sugar ABC transporter substrate-binding protein [Alkalispirochaeta americana]SIR04007.1 monosaccharide ABC transporter substrate-binding protein, CUT2 family [Alkalispirochaeta americana]